MDTIKLQTLQLLPLKEIETFEVTHLAGKTDYGATASFVGTMRDFNEGDDVSSMYLEHYPKMTEQQLQGLVDKAYDQWSVLHSLIVHRVGLIHPGEPIVLVAVWSAHRAAAFDAVIKKHSAFLEERRTVEWFSTLGKKEYLESLKYLEYYNTRANILSSHFKISHTSIFIITIKQFIGFA